MESEQHKALPFFAMKRNPFPYVLGLGLLIALALGYSFYVGSYTAMRDAPLVNAAMEIKLEAAIGHLWFEEVISGDRDEDIVGAMEHMDNSAWYARAMLEGGENADGVIVATQDPDLSKEIEGVLEIIVEFRAIAMERWIALEQSGVGSDVDQHFDALFNDLLIQAGVVEIELQRSIDQGHRHFRIIQTLLIVFCLGLAALTGWMFRNFQKSTISTLAALRKSERNLSITLRSIGDGVVTTDINGHVTSMNPVAESLTGWTVNEAMGLPLAEVFHTLDSKTRRETENSVIKILGQSQTTSLTTENVLIARDKKEFQIANKIAPIHDQQGLATGVVLVFRDVTSSYESEQRLLHSEEKFRSLYDNAPLSYQSLDEDGRFLDINPTWLKTLGYEKQEVIGKKYADFLHPNWQTHFNKNFPEFKRRGYVNDVQFKIRHKNGQYLDISFEGCIGYHPNGSFRQTYCVFQDITLRKRSEAQASKFNHILESSLNEIYLFDAESLLLTEVNRGARNNLGFPVEQLDKMTILDLIPEFSAETFASLVEPLRAQERRIVQFETEIKRQDKTRYPVQVDLQLMTDFGSPLFAAITLDITQRKHAEIERERLVKAIEQTNESIVITDAQGTILYTNPVFEQVTGYTYDEAVGKNANLLKSGEQEQEFYKDLWNEIAVGKTWRGRFINRKKDGTLFSEDSTISPVFDDHGSIINYVAVKRDVSDQLHMEEQFNQAQKVESIGRLAGGVAHDLNNLLTPILGYGEIMLDSFNADDNRKADMEIILHSGMRARDLVRQLLAFSRKQTLEYKLLSLNQILENFSSLLRRTIREDINLNISLSPETGNIKADVGQIEQVILNLTVNAADSMPDGGRMTIETSPVQLDEEYATRHHGVIPGLYHMLAVSDTGSGMGDDIRERIFEPFFSTKGEMGTGLGLATVYGIVKQHGGNIWVYSEMGKGSTFKVFLPSSDESPSLEVVQSTTTVPRKCTETILLAEDNEGVRELARTILTRMGYHVLVANHGTDALATQTAHDGPVDLLLTDVVMPEMNGKQLYELALNHNPQLKVLFMSGYTDNVIAHQGALDEGTNFIQKPFTIDALAAKVQEVLEKK